MDEHIRHAHPLVAPDYIEQMVRLSEIYRYRFLVAPVAVKDSPNLSFRMLKENAAAGHADGLEVIETLPSIKSALAASGLKYSELFWN